MTKLLAALALLGTTLAGLETAVAQSGPSNAFLCNAEASRQRLVPGSAARRAFIDNCIASKSGPAQAVSPTRPRPAPAPTPGVAPSKPFPPRVIDQPKPAAPRLTVEFACSAEASKQRLVPGSAARRAFIEGCIRRARPPRRD